MKRLVQGWVIILLVLVGFQEPVHAHEESEALSEERVHEIIGEEDGTLEWWYNYWELTDDYPDNVSYVRQSTQSSDYLIGLVDNTEEAQQEFLSLVPQTDNIEFEEATYSYNDLRRIQNEVNQRYFSEEDSAVIGTAIGPDYLLVTVDEGAGYEYQEELRSEFGDMIFIEETDFSPITENRDDSDVGSLFDQSDEEVADEAEESAEEIILFDEEESFNEESAEEESDIVLEEEAGDMASEEEEGTLILDIPAYEEFEAVEYSPYSPQDNPYFPLMVMLVCVALAGGGYLLYRKVQFKHQTVEGTTVTGPEMSKEEAESRIKESTFEPSEDVYQSILDKLENNK